MHGFITGIFPKKRIGSNNIEGIYLVADGSILWFLKTDTDKIQKISSFSSGLYCGQYYDIDQDDNYEILIGSKNNKLYFITERGEIIKKIRTGNEVRDICIRDLPKNNLPIFQL